MPDLPVSSDDVDVLVVRLHGPDVPPLQAHPRAAPTLSSAKDDTTNLALTD